MPAQYRVHSPRPEVFRPQYKGLFGLWVNFSHTYHSYAGSSTEWVEFRDLEAADEFLEAEVRAQKQRAEYKALLKKEYPKYFRWPRLNIEKMG